MKHERSITSQVGKGASAARPRSRSASTQWTRATQQCLILCAKAIPRPWILIWSGGALRLPPSQPER
jgi:hypothetical protein